jgi:hypothetical protein
MITESWIIWLTQGGGETFLGLSAREEESRATRFCVLGKFVSDGPNGVGIWVDVDFVQELEIPSNNVVKTWQVKPQSCLILWSYVAYIQRGERSGKIGFLPSETAGV